MDAKRLRVGDIEMAYQEAGAGERPFVLVHGFTGSRDDFVDVLPPLSELGRTVLVDQRGHGDTTNPRDPAGYHFDQLRADLLGFLDALGADRVDLLGHSMGGMVAQRFALEHPERVASLVLMDTSHGPVGFMPKRMVRGVARVGRWFGMGTVYRGARRQAARDKRRPAASRRTEQRMGSERYWARIQTKLESMDPFAFGTLGILLADHESALPRLSEIRCPTLVLVGEEDHPFLTPSEEMAAAIPDATHVVVPDAAHSPQFENEPAWLEAIRTHLERSR